MTTNTKEASQQKTAEAPDNQVQANPEQPLKMKVSRAPFHRTAALPCVSFLW